MNDVDVFLQQIITGLSNGMIISLIALGYTMVYGIVELINFAHGDLFMLGSFFSLTLLGLFGNSLLGNSIDNASHTWVVLPLLIALVAAFCAFVNYVVNHFVYKPLRAYPKFTLLVSAIGVSFIFINLGFFWGGLPMQIFNMGRSASSPKSFPNIVPDVNLLSGSVLVFSLKDLVILLVTVPLLAILTYIVKSSSIGRAMRAVAQDSMAAQLMGINVEKVISFTFVIGGALAGTASVIYAMYNGTIYFQMGYRVGIDAFTAAVLGGVGSLPGAFIGGLIIGFVRAMSDQYIATQWTNVVVFSILIFVILIKPSGLLGLSSKVEKV